MDNFKIIRYYYSSFSGQSGRVEYFIYLIIETVAKLFALYLNENKSLDDKTIIYIFYVNLIILMTFIPIQAVTTRRLRDLKINRGFIFINFIPLINIFFKLYLAIAKRK
jgi:uncharacterized membrane protein YhaH (DUF805 family)